MNISHPITLGDHLASRMNNFEDVKSMLVINRVQTCVYVIVCKIDG